MNGIAQALGVFTNLIKFSKENYNPLSIALLDLNKAFDSIHHNTLFAILSAHGAPASFLNLFIQIAGHSCALRGTSHNLYTRLRGYVKATPSALNSSI
jgi:hypothetical protein